MRPPAPIIFPSQNVMASAMNEVQVMCATNVPMRV